MSDQKILLIGAAIGAAIALTIQFGLTGTVVWLTASAAAGAAIAWIGHGLITGRLNLQRAWQALRAGTDDERFSL